MHVLGIAGNSFHGSAIALEQRRSDRRIIGVDTENMLEEVFTGLVRISDNNEDQTTESDSSRHAYMGYINVYVAMVVRLLRSAAGLSRV